MGNCTSQGSAAQATTPKRASRKSHKKAKKDVAAKNEIVAQEPEPAPVEAPGKGAYLKFDTGSLGVWYVQWSEEPVEGALCHFKPNKTVPTFKYRQNSGRADLMNVGGNKKKYFEGVMQFIKMAHENQGEIFLFENDDVDIFYMDPERKIKSAQPEVWLDSSNISVLAVMPRYSQIFKGVTSTLKEAFIDQANANRGVTWQPANRPKTVRTKPVNPPADMEG